MPRIGFALFLLVLAAVAWFAHPRARAQQPPTFRSAVRAIEVDAFVTDHDGRFVRDLAREDFEILEDGEPQAISAFTLIDLPVEPPVSPTRGKDAQPVDPDIVSNVTEGRLYVMLLDSPGLQIPPRAYVTRGQMFRFTQLVATQFVDESLGPRDRMAMIHVQANRSDAQSFTSNKGLLRESINRLKPARHRLHGRQAAVLRHRTAAKHVRSPEERV